MIPLISSMCQGPAGVCQLPRFWWKVILRQAGQLDPEYPDCSRGLDIWLLGALGLDRDRTLAYLRDQMPGYLAFEAWVIEQKSGALDQYAVARYNDAVARRVHVDPGKIVETYEDIGWGYEKTHTWAVLLNCLQDWQLFYRRDLAPVAATGSTGPVRQPATGPHGSGEASAAASPASAPLRPPVVPLISSIDRGPLDVCQLPRTWLKVILQAHGLLHAEYPACGGGLDARVLELLGLEREPTVEYLTQERPDYLGFEAYVRQHGALDGDRIAPWNRSIAERVHRPEARERLAATLGLAVDQAPESAVTLNHLEDWHLAHQALLAATG